MNEITQSVGGTIQLITFGSAFLTILLVLIPVILLFTRWRRRAARKKRCVAEGLAVIRTVERTGLTVNDTPQLRFEADVLLENGSTFPCTLKKVLSAEELSRSFPGALIPVRYDPQDHCNIVWNDHPDPEQLADLMDRCAAARHPSDLPYDARVEIRKFGVLKKARLDDLRLTGREENGDYEATAVIRITDDLRGDVVARRRIFVSSQELDRLVVGKYVDIRILPNNPDQFIFLFDRTLRA